jgi:small subunit ribosomal protein S6
MRRYEVVFVLAPTLTGDEVETLTEGFVKTAKDKGAEVVEVDKWGKRRLAFRVGKHHEGYYVVVTLEEESATAVTEMERRFKVTDAVIRFLTVRTDLDLKRAEKFRERREAKRKKRPAQAPAEASEPRMMDIEELGAAEPVLEKGEEE